MDLSSTFISSCIQCCCLFKYLKTAPRSDPGHCLYSEYFWEKQLQFALHCFAHLMLSPRRKSSTASEVQDTDTDTHTQVHPAILQVPNCINKIQRRSTWPSGQLRSQAACDNKQRLSPPSLPFLSGSLSVFLSGGFFGAGL